MGKGRGPASWLALFCFSSELGDPPDLFLGVVYLSVRVALARHSLLPALAVVVHRAATKGKLEGQSGTVAT